MTQCFWSEENAEFSKIHSEVFPLSLKSKDVRHVGQMRLTARALNQFSANGLISTKAL